MDCSICSTMPSILRPPRNTICGTCYEGAKSVITLMNKFENDKGSDKASTSVISFPNSCKAARSEIFKNMLGLDACKAAASDTITLAVLNHEELESLLEFLYSGSLATEKVGKHICSLTLAADKYEIPFLLKFCERYMLRSLFLSNALDVLKISYTCSNKILKETALNFIVKNMEDIVFQLNMKHLYPKTHI
ncbi:hypothetical protein P3X46_014481 [Hevea brasiliensis]|uniref:BTB domain-containing protein n=1 Tax=Hevea brasiliensis TaxID=3981 RepID=A0ABQ9MAP3_HEVBR|nr:hypothetical protein P3X46_014481 [Hevea brasiliensis]